MNGSTRAQVRDAAVHMRRESAREKQLNAKALVSQVQAIAADHHLHALAAMLEDRLRRDPSLGGRPLANPTWVMLLFGACIGIFGSASAAARNLADPGFWDLVVRAALRHLDPDQPVPARGPNRDHYQYFTRRLEGHLKWLADAIAELAAQRATEVGLADAATARWSRPDRPHIVGIDGKAFSSPLGTLATERVNPRTGEIQQIRQDPARALYAEGGKDDMVWGTKFAIASIRGHLAGLRVVLEITHIPSSDGRGEGGAFTDQAVGIAKRLPGVTAFTTDGALRGTHINHVQTTTGVQVIAPPRRRDKQHGGIVIDGYGHAAKKLPSSRAQARAFADCSGHDLWAAGGSLFERIVTVDGTAHYEPIERKDQKRERTKAGWSMYARHELPCRETGVVHEWWESLTPTRADSKHGFNRGEYLRAIPRNNEDYERLYAMRADTESLNAELEFGFHKQRIPAWGLHRQTLLVLFAALAHNSWALHVWQRELSRQHSPPHLAA